jgi:hypothetical protein
MTIHPLQISVKKALKAGKNSRFFLRAFSALKNFDDLILGAM